MAWSDRYLGISYVSSGSSFDGCDCWGLLCLVFHEELDIQLPNIPYPMPVEWTPVDGHLRDYDVCLWHFGTKLHVGIMVGDRDFLHLPEGLTARVDRLGPGERDALVGVYRVR